MSANPYFLELLVKERQRELLAMAQPGVVAVEAERRSGLWALRQWLAKRLIRLAWRLRARQEKPVCPFTPGGGPPSASGAIQWCTCPRRGGFAGCPSLPGA